MNVKITYDIGNEKIAGIPKKYNISCVSMFWIISNKKTIIIVNWKIEEHRNSETELNPHWRAEKMCLKHGELRCVVAGMKRAFDGHFYPKHPRKVPGLSSFGRMFRRFTDHILKKTNLYS